MADRSQKLAIIVTAQDLASGKLGLVRRELAQMGTAGKLSAVGLGLGMGAARKTEQAFGHLQNRLTSLAGPLGLIGLAGAAFSVVGALEQGIARVEVMALAVEKLTGVTGLSVHAASQIVALFEKFGIEGDKVATMAGFAEKTLGKLAIGIGDVSTGVSKLTKLETLYGISLHDSRGHAVDYATELNRVADYYTGNASASQKAALAATLFGKSYVTLIPILKLGSKGIAAAAAEADRLGITLKTAQDVANVHAFIDAQREAKEALGGLEVQLGLLVMPDLTSGFKTLTSLIVEHRSDIQALFRDGLKAAEGFAAFIGGTVIPTLQKLGGFASGIWNAIPPPLRDMIAKGFVADRTIKFLFGMSPGHFVLDLGEKALGQGLGGALGAKLGGFFQRGSPTNPMFVKDVGLPGIPGAAPAAGAAGVGLGAVAGTVAVGAVLAGGTALWAGTMIDLANENNKYAAQGLTANEVAAQRYYRANAADQQTLFKRWMGRLPSTADFESGNAKLATAAATATDEKVRDAIESAKIAGVSATMLSSDALVGAIQAEESAFHRDFAALRHAQSPAEMAAAAKKIAEDISKGAGNASNTKDVLAALKADLKNTEDPKLRAALRSAIARVEAKIPGREYVQRQIDKANAILRSSESVRQKTEDLKGIERSLRSHGDIHAANEIKHLIAINNSVKLVRNAIGGILYGGTSSGKTGKDDTYHPPTGGQMGGAKHKAAGGLVDPGRLYRVGETGEEWFRPNVAGEIIPHRGMTPGPAQRIVIAVNLVVNVASKVNYSLRELQAKTKSELRYGKLAAAG